MSDTLCPTDHMMVNTDDKFIVDNMLTDEDLDLDLDPCLWMEMLSNDSSSSSDSMTQLIGDSLAAEDMTAVSPTALIPLQTPETPPSSDRSTPPNFDDLLYATNASAGGYTPYDNHLFITSNANQMPAQNVTLIPAINLCPTLSPLSPVLPATAASAPMVAIKTETNEMIVINNQLNNTLMKANSVSRTSSVTSNSRLDLSQQRREARKLRNREAATISRKRQKEYVQSLETSINGLIKENTDLKSDNERLRQRLATIEEKYHSITRKGYNYGPIESTCNKCRQSLSATALSSNKKATLSLLAVIFMLGLNLAPFGGISITSDKTLSAIDTNPRLESAVKHGPSRALLWNSNVDNDLAIDIIAFNSSVRNGSLSDVNCKSYINQTESRRLATDLRYWVSRVEMEKEEVFRSKRRVKANSNEIKSRYDKPIPLSRLKEWIQKRTETDFNDFYDYSADSYNNKNLKVPHIGFEDLLSAIPRRSDTFYLFSYSSKDHLIIPPIAHNTTTAGDIRPRFSLLMPLISTLNESTIRGTNITYNQISIMQIDCHVINTKMVLFNSKSTSSGDSRRSNGGIVGGGGNGRGQPSLAVKNGTKYRLNSRNKTSSMASKSNSSLN
ncbi:unnamed protein product [Medioppia subpectinata]|uniref:BZIP domain-containing protein n=1 Tax=Medioppia subpectinata TaxID=1979941 RepID=A0A7R9L5H7_9ACAR|nr:unnamed protein product [Medioppia subpectinata]CAG2115750.1 unnamed protein product [Medioppia subpectinata]